MGLISLQFLALALAAIIGLRLRLPSVARDILILGLNGIFLTSYCADPTELAPLLGFIALGYMALLLAPRWNARLPLGLMIGIIIAAFIWLKNYSLLSYTASLQHAPYFVVGLSYILFRIIHVVLDVAEQETPRPPLIRYLNYCLFFPSFLSGPIQRYQDFSRQVDARPGPLSGILCHIALSRIVRGTFLIFVVSATAGYVGVQLQAWFYDSLYDENGIFLSGIFFTFAAFVYAVTLYANFSGYMDMVIGVGQLAGFELPENFIRPYRAKNFLDLWARWHITLSEWFKTYLFNPLLAAFYTQWPDANYAPYLGAVAFFITFMVMGFWHGTTTVFLLYGLLLGLGATINKLWQIMLPRYLGKNGYKTLLQQKWYFQLSRSITLSYFITVLMCLWVDPRPIAPHFGGSAAAMAMGFILLVITCMLIGYLCETLAGWVPARATAFSSSAPSLLQMAWLALALCAIVNIVISFSGSAPEFIYKGF